MRDGPNMSYCMCENTSLAMKQILRAMIQEQCEFRLDMSQDERFYFDLLIKQCKDLVEIAKSLDDDEEFELSPWVDE